MPDPSEKLQTDQETPFSVMWFATHQGTIYEMPDLLEHQVGEIHHMLDKGGGELIIITNVSGVMLSIPRRIIKTAGVGDRCFWEAP